MPVNEKSHSFHEGHDPSRQFTGDSPRVRSASEWRAFWRERGERELTDLLAEAWPPTRNGDATRIATLLGSRASACALAAELGRMREERGAAPSEDEDASAATSIAAWFARA
jgi:hypothetical protein